MLSSTVEPRGLKELGRSVIMRKCWFKVQIDCFPGSYITLAKCYITKKLIFQRREFSLFENTNKTDGRFFFTTSHYFLQARERCKRRAPEDFWPSPAPPLCVLLVHIPRALLTFAEFAITPNTRPGCIWHPKDFLSSLQLCIKPYQLYENEFLRFCW